MNPPDDFNGALHREARERGDDAVGREREEELDRVLEAMSDDEFEHWIGVLIRMFGEQRQRLS